MNRPRAFVINEPLRRNRQTGEMEYMYDTSLAAEHGAVTNLLPPGATPLTPATFAALQEGLQSYTAKDSLVMIGHPVLLAWAAAIAVQKTGGALRTLHWSRDLAQYLLVEVDVSFDMAA